MMCRIAGVLAAAAMIVLLLPMAAGCGGGDAGSPGGRGGEGSVPSVEVTEGDITALASGTNEFAFDLYGRLAGEGNLFFSPYSISTALAMTAAGARGDTEREMTDALHFPLESLEAGPTASDRERVAASFARLQGDLVAEPETSPYELNIANALWGQQGYPFKDSYVELVDRHFEGGLNEADFEQNAEAERVRINAWVEDETRERIVDLIPPGGVDAATALVLTNAVYFKGTWVSMFDEERTEDATFHGESGDATVLMMYQKGTFQYYEDENVQVLEMPYLGDRVSMLVVLPRTDGLMTLRALEGKLTPDLLDGWSGNTREVEDVRVHFPRFEMTWGTEDISGHLMELGIREAFSDRADFTGMSDLRDLFIGPVFHKAFIKVDEEGTEAAAATAVVMKRLAVMEPVVFRADHPFLFVIRDDVTGSILFMGRVADLG